MEKTTYYRDETKLRPAPSWVIWLNMVNFILAFVSIFLLIAGYKILPCLFIIWVLFFSMFSDGYYNYLMNLRYIFNQDEFRYEYDLNREIIPSSNTTVKVVCRNIEKIKRHGKKITVWGNITIKRPLQKVKKLNKITLMLNFGYDSEQIYENIKDYINK